MNETDREIVEILKELFRATPKEVFDADDFLRIRIVRWSIYLTALLSILFFFLDMSGASLPEGAGELVSVSAAWTFTLLFIHINNRLKHSSVILFGLTWASLMFSMYFANK